MPASAPSLLGQLIQRFVVLGIGLAVLIGGLVAPVNAIEITPQWQKILEGSNTPLSELETEVSDGSLQLVVARKIDNKPEFVSVQVTSKNELNSLLRDLSDDSSVLAVGVDRIFESMSDSNLNPLALSQWSLAKI